MQWRWRESFWPSLLRHLSFSSIGSALRRAVLPPLACLFLLLADGENEVFNKASEFLLRLIYPRFPLPFLWWVGMLCNDCCSLCHTDTFTGMELCYAPILVKTRQQNRDPEKCVVILTFALQRGEESRKGNGNKRLVSQACWRRQHRLWAAAWQFQHPHDVCGTLLRDVPAPEEFHNNQAVGCSLMVLQSLPLVPPCFV